eukprot:TRINITY_DN21107_c1_g1_i1.p1 TRINITY_DN21107_c1_g1~~TRINITY_DN21107_c1_g1_i1.p1  ORF type:complete len:882 (-),score=110.24 TRINITY_DN21107_c1_g1_i1:71-2716(-)
MVMGVMFRITLLVIFCSACRVSCYREADGGTGSRLGPDAYEVFETEHLNESPVNDTSAGETADNAQKPSDRPDGVFPENLMDSMAGKSLPSNGKGGLEIPQDGPNICMDIAWVFLVGVILVSLSFCYLQSMSKSESSESRESEEDEAGATKIEVPASTSLSDKVRYAYCLPTVSTLPVSALISVFGMALYSQRGADMSTMALAVALARSCDVVSDPVMSYITDSCRHIAGRRRPFMIMGAPVYGLFMAALLTPPFAQSANLSIWFSIMYVLYYICNTVSNIPYDALGPELSENSADRSRLFFLSGLFDGGGTLLAFLAPEIGYKAATLFGATKEICVDVGELVNNCASGESCALFYEFGKGRSFVKNSSFIPNMSLQMGHCEPEDPAQVAAVLAAKNANPALAGFCDCIQTCLNACNSANRSFGFSLAGVFFGIWYVVTAYLCCYVVKERPAPSGGHPRSPTLVPSILGVLRNPAFRALLPAWACDAVAQAIFLALCPFFIMYVVAPEYQTPSDNVFGIDCLEGARGVSTSTLYDRRCNTQFILGACVFTALLCALLTTPVWLRLVLRYGKVKLWLAWSFTMAVTNFMFLAVQKSFIIATFVVCGLNGIPLAAKFLADSILADIIDYDEFLTGRRNEATYTMFKSFLPKVMAIPAAAFPLAIMNAAGHIPVENGFIQRQPEMVVKVILVMTGGVSGLAGLLAFYIKSKYPLDTEAKVEAIAEGIAKHKAGEPGVDPLSGQEYELTFFTEQENIEGVWVMDHFPGTDWMQQLDTNPQKSLESLSQRCIWEVIAAVVLLLASTAGLAGTIRYLDNAVLAFVPTLCAVILGVSILLVGFSVMRTKAAFQLLGNPPSGELVKKVLRSRIARERLVQNPTITTTCY